MLWNDRAERGTEGLIIFFWTGFCVCPVCLDDLILAVRCSSVPFTHDVVFVLWRVGAIPGNACGVQGQNMLECISSNEQQVKTNGGGGETEGVISLEGSYSLI